MASNRYRRDRVAGDNDPCSGNGKGDDTERAPQTVGLKGQDDPFGDETHSEVKYKTMKWWYVVYVLRWPNLAHQIIGKRA